jgi:Uma2 family endonuclease
MTTDEYLHSYETNRPRELAYGIVREPPAPFFSHQQVVLKIVRRLADHAEGAGLGIVAVAPLDVILDAGRSLIVQPDVVFVSKERTSIIRDQVWGAPDLVVEVLSPGTAAHDRTEKLGWYRQYGVRECWLVDPAASRITVFDFTGASPTFRVSEPPATVRSVVLTDFVAPAGLLLP